MNSTEFRDVLSATFAALPKHADELRQLDAAIGDGDLGVTVGKGSSASVEALAAMPPTATISDSLIAIARAFSTANPSTFGALTGSGMIAAAKATSDVSSFGPAEARLVLGAGSDEIRRRGGAGLGDKTILDALLPSLAVLDEQEEKGFTLDLLDDMITAADTGVRETTGLQSRKGRAAWTQERSVGHADPGATAYLRFLEVLRSAIDEIELSG